MVCCGVIGVWIFVDDDIKGLGNESCIENDGVKWGALRLVRQFEWISSRIFPSNIFLITRNQTSR